MNQHAPKKIMMVIPNLAKGGVERVVSVLSQAFEHEYQVIVVTYESVIDYPVGGKLISLSLGKPVSWFKKFWVMYERMRTLKKIIATEKPDTIISFIGNIPAIMTGYPVVVSIQAHYERMKWFDRLALKTIYHFKNVQQIIVPSEGLKKSLEMKSGLKNISVIPNPSNLEIIHEKMLELPEKKHTSSDYLVAVGRLMPVKNFDLLIRAFASTHLRDTKDLLILGEGPERVRLESLIAELKLSRVFLVGNVNNPFPYLKNARYMVLSSKMETFANVIVESLACGTPVIATDCDFGPREIIRNGQDGLLVPNDDQDAL